MSRTMAQKVWSDHVIHEGEGLPDLLYIDMHLVHEVTSPQAFDGLRAAGRKLRRPDLTVATEDHNIPTFEVDKPIADPVSRIQVETLRKNCDEFGVTLYPLGDIEQGIVHVVGPQMGLTPARHDGRVRGLTHQYSRCIWSSGVWNWDQRG